MADKNRSTVVPAGNLKKAAEVLSKCAGDIYALDDIGRRFAGNLFSPLTLASVVEALAASIRSNLEEAQALLPSPLAPPSSAQVEIGAAQDALDALVEVVVAITNDDRLHVTEQTAGMVIFDLTVGAAKCIERAELACGVVDPSTHYLSGSVRDPNRPRHG